MLAQRATWRSGDAADCKSAHPGSIPGVASRLFRLVCSDFGTFAFVLQRVIPTSSFRQIPLIRSSLEGLSMSEPLRCGCGPELRCHLRIDGHHLARPMAA